MTPIRTRVSLLLLLFFLLTPFPGIASASTPASSAIEAPSPGNPSAVKPALPPSSVPLAISVEEAVRIGVENNRDIEIARLETRMSEERIREAWSEVLPQVTTSATYTRYLEPSVIFFPIGILSQPPTDQTGSIALSQDNSMMATVNLNQTLFKLSAFAGIRASSLVRRISEQALRLTKSEVVTNVRRAYYDVLIANERLELVAQSIARWEVSRRDTQALFRQGLVADVDTLRAFLSVENLKPDLIRAESNIAIATTRLKTVMGIDHDTELVLTGSLQFQAREFPETIAVAYAEALDNRPDVKQLAFQLDAEDEKVTAARSEGFPELSAFGQWQIQTQFDDSTPLSETTWPDTQTIGLQLSVPIFTGFRVSSRIQQAKIARMQTRTRLEELKAQVRADVEVRLANLVEARRRIQVQSKTIQVAERSYRITSLRLREGIGSRLELADAELQLNTAKVNYLVSVYDYLVASAEFERTLGRVVPLEVKG